MAQETESNCHNAPIQERDGKKTCSVCGKECENAGTQTSNTQASSPAGGVQAPKMGDKCVLPEGGEGIISPDGDCVPVATSAEMPKVGDACEIEGKQGVFEQGENGLVCVPKGE